MRRRLLGESHKTRLSVGKGVLVRVLYLAPADESGINVCRFATAGCRAACLGHSSGRMVMPTHKLSRIRKTRELFADRAAFVDRLAVECAATVRAAERAGLEPAVRLNGASDLPWERMPGSDDKTLMERFPSLAFYDYTKDVARARASLMQGWPVNYRLVLSRSGENGAACFEHLRAGGNVAVVFDKPPFPALLCGFPVINGDEHDARHLDPRGVIVGLKAKGAGKRDRSGFVLPNSVRL